MFNGARVVGPALAGMLVASIGEGWCFAANAVSYVAVIAGLSRMRVAPRGVPSRASSGLADLLEGFRFAWRTVPIRMLLLTLGLVSFVAMPYTVLMPIFADGILHAGPRGLGILMGASGLGALAGALTLAARTDLRGLGRWIAVAMAGFGSGLTAFALSRSFWPSAALLLVSGACMMVQMSASNTLIQAMVPDHLRGRVMAIYSMMFMGLAPLGALLAGSLAERLGAPVIVAVGGALAVLGSLAFSLLLPSLRPEAARLIGAQHSAAGEPPLGSPRVA
jgi:MFS family permease